MEKRSKIKDEYPELEHLMFNNKDAKRLAKKKKHFKEKKLIKK